MAEPVDAPDLPRRWPRLVATVLGLGERLPAPGTTAGSLPTALLWWALASSLAGNLPILAVVTAVLTVVAVLVGVPAAGIYARQTATVDPGPVVVDEVAGQLLTFLVALPWVPLEDHSRLALAVAAGFVLFRVADILKPWPANRLEALPGGRGIMADDLAAAVYAGAGLVLLCAWISP
jgi:phosphatidylglycerophosphatase A